MKKFISVVLALCMLFALTTSAFAADTKVNKTEETVSPNTIDDELPQAVRGNDTLSSKKYNIDTEFEGIKKSKDDCYAMVVETADGEVNVPVGKLEIDLSSESDIEAVLSNEKIALEIKERLQERYEQAVECGNTDAKAVLFSEELLPAEKEPNTRGSTYTTYKGARMRSDKICYTGLSTRTVTIKSGTGTKNTCSSVYDFIMTAATYEKHVSFFSTSITLFRAFMNAWGGEWVTGTTKDKSEMYIQYDNIDQWTYKQVGDEWRMGLCTQRATVTKIWAREYYWDVAKNKGIDWNNTRYVSIMHMSPDFSSPWAKAYQYAGNPYLEWMNGRCGNVTFCF